jgi:TRAP-type mannitol/chloroaromatic compound transport system permease large subunit
MDNPVIANIVLFGSFLALMMTGFPIAFCLLGIGLVGLFFYIGWDRTVILARYDQLLDALHHSHFYLHGGTHGQDSHDR